jgi:formylglycine-generating enzyme required for sulfatase activity
MGENPAVCPDLRCPIENVSWVQVTAPCGFLDRLNANDVLRSVEAGDAAARSRLPSEAEREYEARGGPRWQDDLRSAGAMSKTKSRGMDGAGGARISPW